MAKVTLGNGFGSISLSIRSELLLVRCCLESHLRTLLILGSSSVQRACMVPQATALASHIWLALPSSLPPSQLPTLQSCLAASKTLLLPGTLPFFEVKAILSGGIPSRSTQTTQASSHFPAFCPLTQRSLPVPGQ